MVPRIFSPSDSDLTLRPTPTYSSKRVGVPTIMGVDPSASSFAFSTAPLSLSIKSMTKLVSASNNTKLLRSVYPFGDAQYPIRILLPHSPNGLFHQPAFLGC